MKKIILITGASSDIGLKLIDEIKDNYEKIILQYRTLSSELETIINNNKDKVIPLQSDFSDIESINKLIITINKKGYLPNTIVHFPSPKFHFNRFNKESLDNFNQGWIICVQSIILILQAFIPNMKRNKYGRVVFMLTSCTTNIPPKYLSSYVTVKYALLGLMKSLSSEYSKNGILFNGVSPNMIETKFLSEIPKLLIEENKKEMPNNRNITIKETIRVIAYLLDEKNESITGQNIAITGGK